ncbi:MAG TPA: hypothetical protein VM124_02940 [Candidatus Limnocylindrales bacterium]|nr:hypothetical protein [Candidatus Limnocylindrales bacterium]
MNIGLYFGAEMYLLGWFVIALAILVPAASVLLLSQTVKGLKNAKTKSSRRVYAIFLSYLIMAFFLVLVPINKLRAIGAGMLYALFWSPLAIIPGVLVHMIWKKRKGNDNNIHN